MLQAACEEIRSEQLVVCTNQRSPFVFGLITSINHADGQRKGHLGLERPATGSYCLCVLLPAVRRREFCEQSADATRVLFTVATCGFGVEEPRPGRSSGFLDPDLPRGHFFDLLHGRG